MQETGSANELIKPGEISTGSRLVCSESVPSYRSSGLSDHRADSSYSGERSQNLREVALFTQSRTAASEGKVECMSVRKP